MLARRASTSALAIAIASAAACSPTPSVVPPATAPTADPGPTTGAGRPADDTHVLVLLGTPAEMRLGWLDGSGHPQGSLAVPTGTRWAAGRPSHGLVASGEANGRLFASDSVAVGGAPEWTEIALDPAARAWLGRSPAVAVPDADGPLIAVVAADPGAGALETHVVIIDRTGGPATIVAVPGTWDGRAPAWIAPGRIAVSTRDATDRPGLVVVDLATGRSEREIEAIGAYAISDDGSTIVFQLRDGGGIAIGPLARALSGPADELDTLPVLDRRRVAAQVLLDAAGRRLAVAWLDEAGDTAGLAIYDLEAGRWRLVLDGPLPAGVTRAVLVSLDP